LNKFILLFTLLAFSVSSFAQKSEVPKYGFYGGLGGNYSFVNFSQVDANTLGLSEIYINGNKVQTGSAKGPFSITPDSESKLGPTLQVGYFQKFNNSSWLWGSKLSYSYVGTTSTSPVLEIPQFGSNSSGDTFEGVAVVQSFQYSLNHQFSFTPYFGISSGKTFFYLGAGISMSETKEEVNDVVGYAFIQNDTVNISGEPTDFSSTNWVWGFAATAGGTYFLSQSLFLDLSYTFNSTQTQVNDFKAPFSNSKGPFSTSGELIGRTSANEVTNSITLTVNKIF